MSRSTFPVGVLLAVGALLSVARPTLAQMTPEQQRAQGQMQREQQNEEMVQRLRQSQQTQDALRRGADPTQLRGLEQQQLHDRATQQRLHQEQLQRMQSLPPNSNVSPQVEAQRAARERDEQRFQQNRPAPSWGPVLDPVPPPRGPQAPGVAQ